MLTIPNSVGPTYTSLLAEVRFLRYLLFRLADSLTPSFNGLKTFAKNYPNISFTHIFPGLVITPLMQRSLLTRMLGFFMWFFAKYPQVSQLLI